MEFKEFLSKYSNKTCIMSVEKYPDNQYGNISIVEGNKAHYDDMLNTLHHPFVPDSPYEEYFPQNRNFEDFCYRCAILGQPLHTYVELPQMGLWLHMFLLPLESDKENVGDCLILRCGLCGCWSIRKCKCQTKNNSHGLPYDSLVHIETLPFFFLFSPLSFNKLILSCFSNFCSKNKMDASFRKRPLFLNYLNL